MAEFQGSSSVQEQPKERTFSQGAGWSTVRTWTGPRDDVFEFAKTLVGTGPENISVVDEGPTATAKATYPDAQDAAIDSAQETDNVEWELIGNDLEKKLQTHSQLDPGEDDTKLEHMGYAMAAVANGEKKNTRHNPTTGAVESFTWGPEALIVYTLMTQGVEAYVLTQYVLRKTIKVARAANVTASLTNVNKVEAPVGVPVGLFSVPTNQGDANTIEWLKKPPQVRYLGRGKFAITQEWWAGTWSIGLYGGTHSP
jgi:hypothetical protein